MPLVSLQEWKVFVQEHPKTHLLQSAEWGMLKEKFNWKVIRVIVGTAGAQILLRQIFPGVKLAYIPKGPVGMSWEKTIANNTSWNSLMNEIDAICHQENVLLLKIEPDTWEIVEKTSNDGDITIEAQTINPPNGFRRSTHAIQPRRTMIVDLSINEDLILGRMKQKTRYNIGLARRKNIVIHPSADVNGFFHMMEETGARDQFFIHNQTYYQLAYDLFHPYGYCELLQADSQDIAIAGVMIFAFGDRSWYLYGASSNVHRNKMPSYLLQWEAMLWAKRKGCVEHDLWGVPDEKLSFLEDQFTNRNDGLWGVYRFKRGFGGELRRSPDPWDRVYNPLLYNLYNWWIRRKSRLP
jgi:peptidoglycan pentaglycine glycine transferase (the first glycine)